jgi:signal transduction histidine kinase
LDDLGIIATINWFCREFKFLYAPIRLDHTINVEEGDVPEHLKTVIYRILQEALNNVAKHSRAGRLSIGLEKKDALLVFGISDDGIGFDPEQVVSLKRSERGLGLASMRERTELTGGHFFISSGRQTGTTIRIVWSLAVGEQRIST